MKSVIGIVQKEINGKWSHINAGDVLTKDTTIRTAAQTGGNTSSLVLADGDTTITISAGKQGRIDYLITEKFGFSLGTQDAKTTSQTIPSQSTADQQFHASTTTSALTQSSTISNKAVDTETGEGYIVKNVIGIVQKEINGKWAYINAGDVLTKNTTIRTAAQTGGNTSSLVLAYGNTTITIPAGKQGRIEYLINEMFKN